MKLFPWADFRKGKGGIKLTFKLVHQGKSPLFLVMSNVRRHEECGNDADMDSDDSVSVILSVESEVKEFKTVIYQFYFGDKDNVVSEVFSS